MPHFHWCLLSTAQLDTVRRLFVQGKGPSRRLLSTAKHSLEMIKLFTWSQHHQNFGPPCYEDLVQVEEVPWRHGNQHGGTIPCQAEPRRDDTVLWKSVKVLDVTFTSCLDYSGAAFAPGLSAIKLLSMRFEDKVLQRLFH